MKPNYKALAAKYRQMHLDVLRHYGDSLRALTIRFEECKQERDEWKAKYNALKEKQG